MFMYVTHLLRRGPVRSLSPSLCTQYSYVSVHTNIHSLVCNLTEVPWSFTILNILVSLPIFSKRRKTQERRVFDLLNRRLQFQSEKKTSSLHTHSHHSFRTSLKRWTVLNSSLQNTPRVEH